MKELNLEKAEIEPKEGLEVIKNILFMESLGFLIKL